MTVQQAVILLCLILNLNGIKGGFDQNAFLMGFEEDMVDHFEGDYEYHMCDGVPSTVSLDAKASPKQFYISQNITMFVKLNITKTINAPLLVQMKIFKKVPYMGYMKLPCIFNYGSCTYKDVCANYDKAKNGSLARKVLCPKWYQAFGIKCGCPIPKGFYKTGKVVVPVATWLVPKWMAAGDYKITLMMEDIRRPVMCYKFRFRLK